MKRMHSWVLVLLVAVCCPICCPVWAGAASVTITDASGRTLTFAEPVRRIVSLSVSGVVCLQIMDRMDTLVGITEHTATRLKRFPELQGLPGVGRGFAPNLEVIAELKPDMVLAWKSNPGQELERQLEPLGIPVVRLDFTEPSAIAQEMRTFATLLGAEAQRRTEAYLHWVACWTAFLQKRIAGHTPPTVLAEHFTPMRIAGSGSGLYELTRMAGGRNLAQDLGVRSMQADSEWIFARNPQIVVKSVLLDKQDAAEDAKRLLTARQRILKRSHWHLLDAVQNQRVYVLDSDIASGPQYLLGLAELIAQFYPTASLPDPASLHEDLYNERWLEADACPPQS